jgi:probable rRNA maturation factor
MIELDNRIDIEFDITLLTKITDTFTQKDVELIITDNSEIQQINSEFRNIDKPTDVLSFPYEDSFMTPLGSIIISIDFIKSESEKFKHSLADELTLLYIHGLLHILGYDHEIDNGEMRAKEEELIKEFNLPHSLIVRVEG